LLAKEKLSVGMVVAITVFNNSESNFVINNQHAHFFAKFVRLVFNFVGFFVSEKR